jgi:cell division control protein 6
MTEDISEVQMLHLRTEPGSTTIMSTVTYGYSRIFRDKDLFEVDHIPDSILHRETQIKEIKQILADTIRPKNIIALGGFGTGKTATLLHICRDLPPGYRLIYVSCSKGNTQTRILKAMLAELGQPQKNGFPQDHYRGLLEAELKRRRYVILVLDEVDQLLEHRDSEADAFFYILSRMPEWKNVVAALVSNRFDIESLLRKHLDPRTLDTFRWKRTEFCEYNAAELGDILEDRCRKGLRDNSCDKGIIAQIALISYNQGLGARGVIDITREAGLIAEHEQRDSITPEDVREASSVDQRMKTIQSLTPIDKALVHTIFREGIIQTSRLHAAYYPKIAETYGGGQGIDVLERHIQKLFTFGLVKRQQSGLGKGKGSEIWLTIAPDMHSAIKKSVDQSETQGSTAPPLKIGDHYT